ncbi:MAG: RAD55 family ATPase, partial [Tepidisphaerales bacterium]
MDLLETNVAPLLTEKLEAMKGSDGRPLVWLDEMLCGGLRRPSGLKRPLVVLLSGPPGSGKSLLAQQICYARGLKSMETGPSSAAEEWRRSIIISAETPALAIAQNLERFSVWCSVVTAVTEVSVAVLRGNREERIPDGIHDGAEGAGRGLTQ